MFLHVLKYECKVMLRVRELLFWNLLFPFALATFMYVAFGNIAAATENFRVIPAAVVEEQENPALTQVLRELSKEGEGRLLDLKETSREEAEKKAGDIYAVFRKKQDADYVSEFDRQTAKYLKGEK